MTSNNGGTSRFVISVDNNRVITEGEVPTFIEPTFCRVQEANWEEHNFTHCIKHPVTFELFDPFCFEAARPLPEDQGWGRFTRPVINIRVEETLWYCNYVSLNMGLIPHYIVMIYEDAYWAWVYDKSVNQRTVKIPTTAMWQIISAHAATMPIDDIAWYGGNSGNRTHPVCEKAPDRNGLYDVIGNVWKLVFVQNLPAMTPAIWKEKFPNKKYMEGVEWYPGRPFIQDEFEAWTMPERLQEMFAA